tara:strand:- start:1396 stop:1626 length:231 start_codon:yes stop_codon:yes gene_type:complete
MNKEKALNYLQKKAESDKEAALLSFDLLLDKPVGIGDHSTGDFLSNLEESLDKLVDASDRLEKIGLLRKVFRCDNA